MMLLVADQLEHRYDVQARLKVRDMPFLMGQKLYLDSDNLTLNDSIEPAMRHGSVSIGFIGLAEALTALCGQHHGESEEAQQLGEEIIQHMRDVADGFATTRQKNYTLLATPAEGLSGRFVKIDRKDFGDIAGVTDKIYYTNSFHIPVSYKISAFDKIRREGVYHKYCNAGHISYIEFTSPPVHNAQAVEDLLRHMKNCDIGYAGINFPIDFCAGCGYMGVIEGNECPACGLPTKRRVVLERSVKVK